MAAAPTTVNDLPEELLIQILSYLSLEDLALRAQFVCCRWSQVCSADVLWKDSSFTAQRYLSVDYVLSFLQTVPKLKRFVTTKPSSRILNKLAERCTELEVFTYEFPWLHDCEEAFANIFRQCTKLKTLEIPGLVLINEQLAALAGQLTDLRGIFLKYISDKPVKLREISSGSAPLEQLDLGDFPWCYSDVKYLLERKGNKLVYLGICHISVEGVYIYPLLKICGTVLRKLQLRNAELLKIRTQTLTFSMMSTIRSLSNLTSLTIDVPVKEDVLVKIFEKGALSQLLEIEINMGSGVEGVLINVLCENCPDLLRMVLYDCFDLLDDGLKYLHKCDNLEELCLHQSSSLTDDAMEHVCKCTKLKTLRLQDCQMTEEGLTRLLELYELRHVDLSGCNVAGVPFNFFHLYLKNLEKLNLASCTNVDKVALAILKSEMPKLRVFFVG